MARYIWFWLNRLAIACVHFSSMMVIIVSLASGQVSTGTPAFGSYGGGPFDTVNLGNLNVDFVIPIINKPGRGGPFVFNLVYNSSIWKPVTSNGTTSWSGTAYSSWGWTASSPMGGSMSYTTTTSTRQVICGYIYLTSYTNWTYFDGFGTPHVFAGQSDSWTSSPGCNSTGTDGFAATASDGSGYTLNVNGTSINSLTAANGTHPMAGSYTSQDANGNLITAQTANGTTTYTDTLNTNVLTISGSGTPSSPKVFSYTAPAGPENYQLKYTQYTVQTGFGFSGAIAEYGPVSNALVSSLLLPDGVSQYIFKYEQTPVACTPLPGTDQTNCVTGRIASVTLPTGGTVFYTYPGGPHSTGIYSDGSTAGLTRALSPSTSCTTGCWQYSRALVSGTPGPGSTWTTTITDADPVAQNQTVINFSEDSATTPSTYNLYETQRLTYSGSSTGGTLLTTMITCYNNTNPTVSSCPGAAVTPPINNQTTFAYLPNAAGQQAKTFISYYQGIAAFPTEIDSYDYGTGSPGSVVRKVSTTYTSAGSTIVPTTIQVKDGGNNTISSTTLTYDEGTIASTSGTPQHVSVSGGRGNLTTLAGKVNSTQTLYRKFTYFDTGNVQNSYDSSLSSSQNGPLTSFSYDNSGSPSPSCGNSFPTTITLPNNLTQGLAWDCNGGAQTSATDENGNVTRVAYKDPNSQVTSWYWRPATLTDQLTNVTGISYSGATVATSSLPSTPTNWVVAFRSQLDGLGRAILSQRQQGPGATNYDTVETDYDAVGRVAKVTLPFSATAGGTNSSAPGTSIPSYDGLSRPLSVTDSGGGSVSYSYVKNDVLQTLGPPPGAEHTKQKQLEYDALGNLSSVCELTTGPGSATCAQSNSSTGYWTRYKYDAAGNLLGVCQNTTQPLSTDCVQTPSSGQQTRSYTYDQIGRLLTENNPETGSTTYVYDSDSACGSTSYPGNLVKRVDANGNVTCYAYDAMQRLTSVTYISGPNTTPTKKFLYGTASSTTINGIALNNTADRMVEAYTCSGTCSSKIADLLFSYSPRGEIADVYESTPNSGTGYYRASSQYWPNGVLNTLSLKNSSGTDLIPVITYGPLEAEGRISAITAASGTNPVYLTSYNVASQVTGVSYMSSGSDNDAFTFDQNTFRMTDYQFNVGSTVKQDWGHLNWNANGTLGSLAITDQWNTNDSQTCNYFYDDLGRLAGQDPNDATHPSINCGTKWKQGITLDAFGNISKSATVGTSFQATYTSNPPTNRISLIASSVPTYDSNGNLTNDTAHQYTWDAEGHMLTIDNGSSTGVCLTYDALGRAVEAGQGSSCSTFTQIVYGPGGFKFALTSGQTLQKAFVPLTGGAKAVYNATGLLYFRHPDWLGSSRISSKPSRSFWYGTAYAPYGENYVGKTASGGAVDLNFTGQNEDTTSWLYDFMLREYNPTQGRWMSPDPAGIAALDLEDPQTCNRYAYVGNNPLGLVDPLGLSGCINPLVSEHFLAAYLETKLLASLLGKTVGVGVGGGVGLGVGGSKYGIGGQFTGSVLVATDSQGNSGLLYSFGLGPAGLSSIYPKTSGGLVGGANGGGQIFFSGKTLDQLSKGFSFSLSGSYGPVGLDAGTNGVAVTIGGGVGGRLGGGPLLSTSGMIPICKLERSRSGGGGGGNAGLFGGMGTGWDGGFGEASFPTPGGTVDWYQIDTIEVK